jgi:CHAD domain-containing protein/uncharacterized protein YjbK
VVTSAQRKGKAAMENEVESRFIVPDRLLFARLLKLRSLGDYVLKRRGVSQIVDEYLDTQGRALTRQGWACRLRRDGASWVATLKGPRAGEGAITSRPEIEVTLADGVPDYTLWPQGELRDRVAELSGGVALGKLVMVQQERHTLLVSQAERPVALLSLDVVRSRGRGLKHKSYMLECELQPGGDVSDLRIINQALAERFDLLPEPRSKLRRALEVVEHGDLPDADLQQQLREVTPGELVERYEGDASWGEHVSAVAGQLFGGLQEVHGLPPEFEQLTRAAGLLVALGRDAGLGAPQAVARALVLRHNLSGLDDTARQMVAAAVFLQRKRVSPERIAEVLPESFSAEERRQALTVAALVRIAAGLDKRGQVTIERIYRRDSAFRLLLAGPHGDKAARRAVRRSDLWAMLYATRLEWGLVSLDGDVVLSAKEAQRALGLNVWDAMPTAARKVLSYWHQQMLDHEAGTRLGEDPEELHDMRVATRRLRSAIGLFRPYLTGPELARANERLRRATSVLGAVRDLDVAIDKARTFAERFPPEERPQLARLLALWGRRREQARRTLLRYLDGREYARLLQTMAALLTSLEGDADWAEGNLAVGRLAPRLLYVYDAVVEAYDAVLADAPVQLLHALRIDCKRLRYGLEFFREVLAPEIVALIPSVVGLQEHLGELHDEYVAVEMIQEFVAHRGRSHARAGAETYRDACAARLQELEVGFPEVWRSFMAQKARECLQRQVGKRKGKGQAAPMG